MDLRYVKMNACQAPYAGYKWHILGDPWPGTSLPRARCYMKLGHGYLIVDQPTDSNLTCRGCLRELFKRGAR
jgi:hypothetical protein